MNALSALGLAYYDSDDDEDADGGDEGNATPTLLDIKKTVIEGTAAAPAPMSHSSQAVLPDAGALLSDLPDKVDWNARGEDSDAQPQYDPKGTRYNSVPLPKSMVQEQSSFNAMTGGTRLVSGSQMASGSDTAAAVAAGLSAVDAASLDATAAGKRSEGAGGLLPSRRTSLPKASTGGLLLPPQLRRPNVATEDIDGIRAAKRPRPAPK